MTIKAIIGWVAGLFGGLLVLYVLGFLATGGNLAIYRFWAPQFRDAQREVFERSQSFVQGKVQYIARLRLEYEAAPEGRKESLRRLILTEASQVDPELLPVSTRTFVESLSRVSW